MTVVTNQPIQQVYLIRDITTVMTTYNRIRWYRGRDGSSGPFYPATASTVQAAVLRSRKRVSANLVDRSLLLRVNGTELVTVAFTDPESGAGETLAGTGAGGAAPVAALMDATSVVLSDVDGYLSFTTVATGTGASLEILESEAAPYLGFLTGEATVGLGADGALLTGIHEYTFLDQNSDPSFLYRVELFHTATGRTSGLSLAFPSAALDSIPYTDTIGCFIRLASFDGRPLPQQTIAIHNVSLPNLVTAGSALWGIFRSSVTLKTDASGYAETRLIRGSVVDVSVVGAGFTRRITVPDTGDLVDLLEPTLSVGDEFEIQEFNVDFAIRTN